MQFIQAKNYTPVGARAIDLIVIHDMESPEKPDTAEAVAHFFANQPKSNSGSSAHYCCDNNSAVGCVKDHDVAWHAPGANHNGLGFEHAGRASQSRGDWLDPYSKRMLLSVSAPLVASKAKLYKIPPVYLTAAALVAGRRGITTHLQVTKAFSHGIGHTDPGTAFPMDLYIATVQKLMNVNTNDAPNHGQAVVTPEPTIKEGATGWRVGQLQRLLNFEEKRAWDDIKVDGVFGARTTSEVKEFQTRAGLKPDGIVGANTWHALWTARYS